VNRRSRWIRLVALVALLAAALASPAAAARRKVPVGFFGTVLAPPADQGINTYAALDQQMALMASSGVESVRLPVPWSVIEPSQGVYEFGSLDRLVAAAARHGLSALVNVSYTPSWDSPQPTSPVVSSYAPRDPKPFAGLMRQLVLRYGPTGTLWRTNPRPTSTYGVRQWQIWNEEDAPWYWRGQSWPPGYTKLLAGAYRAIHAADRGATVVAGSLVASSFSNSPWVALRDMYRAGAKKYFDEISVHPFTNNPSSASDTANRVLVIVQRMRDQMHHYGDDRKPIILTEMTWASAAGQVPQGALLGFETTPKGQAQRLAAAYGALVRAQSKMRIAQAYWFSWTSEYSALGSFATMVFRYTGLTAFSGGVFSPTPLLATYASTAAKYEGCRKRANARCA
jgi:hypothetical protein